MEDLRELYQEIILDHNRDPRNFKKLEHVTHESEGFNPLCGDKVSVYVDLDGDRIKDVSFEGQGCAISKASASVMTTLVKGKTVDEARSLFKQFKDVITSSMDTTIDTATLGKMAVFAGVREFPTRVKCAALAWHTLAAALTEKEDPVTTE